MKLTSLLLTIACLSFAPESRAATENGATAAATSEVRELKRRLRQVTAEADALWMFVGSGPDNPNVKALERAAALLDLRRAAP